MLRKQTQTSNDQEKSKIAQLNRLRTKLRRKGFEAAHAVPPDSYERTLRKETLSMLKGEVLAQGHDQDCASPFDGRSQAQS